MSLAHLINTHLVEPQERRLIARGHAEGRAEALDELRPLLRARGIDLDDLILATRTGPDASTTHHP